MNERIPGWKMAQLFVAQERRKLKSQMEALQCHLDAGDDDQIGDPTDIGDLHFNFSNQLGGSDEF